MAHDDRQAGVAILGYGAIGSVVADGLLANADGPPLRAVVARSGAAVARAALPDGVAVTTLLEVLRRADVGLVVECCGHDGLLAAGPAILESGRDLMVISTGVFARPGLLDAWRAMATRHGGRILVPAGAIAGLDGLGACRRAGLTRVVYTSTKPPAAWRGTPAERAVDLDALTVPTVVFEGSARDAALAFPKNANLAATVALAGLGLEETLVRLVADPAASGNTGHIAADSVAGRLEVTLAGPASTNPKTSAITAYSLIQAVVQRTATMLI